MIYDPCSGFPISAEIHCTTKCLPLIGPDHPAVFAFPAYSKWGTWRMLCAKAPSKWTSWRISFWAVPMKQLSSKMVYLYMQILLLMDHVSKLQDFLTEYLVEDNRGENRRKALKAKMAAQLGKRTSQVLSSLFFIRPAGVPSEPRWNRGLLFWTAWTMAMPSENTRPENGVLICGKMLKARAGGRSWECQFSHGFLCKFRGSIAQQLWAEGLQVFLIHTTMNANYFCLRLIWEQLQ